ncbi:MAG TPA: histidine kinase [Flavisolibacter sp.]|jgi:sensor histidine kinase YesM|nr:histidine kinase [Flavisolibacter sp.]
MSDSKQEMARFEKRVLLIGIVMFSLVRIISPNGIAIPGDWPALVSFLFQFVGVVAMWLSSLYLARLVRRWYPGLSNTLKRILLTEFVCLVTSIGINQGQVYIGREFLAAGDPPMTLDNFLLYSVNLALVVLLITGMLEAIYQQYLLRLSQKQKNELLRQQAENKLRALRGKINPHFLFNSLNTISSLLYRDAGKAESFVEELSTVYRYLLRNYDGDLTTLENEIRFIRSYATLLLIRFEGSLQIRIQSNEKLFPFLVPPTSLQLLLDYIIRTNIVSATAPLSIRIYTERNFLVVENNRQPKMQTIQPETSELDEIFTRYNLLTNKEIGIVETETLFKIHLPLQDETSHAASSSPVLNPAYEKI